MKTIIIQVENLKCGGCASTITKGLLKFDDVESVDIDIDNSAIKISFTGNDEDKYKKKLSSLGYPEMGNNNTISVAKSFVSCAVGKVTK